MVIFSFLQVKRTEVSSIVSEYRCEVFSINVCPIVDSLDQQKWLLQNGKINGYSVNNTQEYNHFARVQQMLPMWNFVHSSLFIQFLYAFIQIMHHRCLTFQFVHQSLHLWCEKFHHHRHLSTKNTQFEKNWLD